MTVDAVTRLDCAVYKMPTDGPEADGTLAWNATTMVVVDVHAAGNRGLGWTYGSGAARSVVEQQLAEVVCGSDPHERAGHARGHGPGLPQPGSPRRSRERHFGGRHRPLGPESPPSRRRSESTCSAAVATRCPCTGAAGSPPTTTKGRPGSSTPGSQTGTSRAVKIKIGESWGSNPNRDRHRVALARRVIGDDAELFVDANGAYSRKQAIRMGRTLVDDYAVSWFEEPVSSDDLAGLREIRDQCQADIAAGEYGYDLTYFAPLVTSGAVDCVQVDVTRCGGYTEWMAVAQLAAAHGLDTSAHCAPNLHAHVAAAVPRLRHIEYFHDHHRIEQELFDGALDPTGGALCPERNRPGHGLSLRADRAQRYRVS